MVSEVKVVKLPLRHALVIAATIPIEEIGAKLAEILPAVYKHARSKGVAPGGPPFTQYLAWNTDQTTDIEAGFTVPQAVTGEGSIQAVELPAGEAAMVTYTGPYDKLGDAHAALGKWVKENERQTAGAVLESYITDPGNEPDPSKWRTDVYWPIK